MQIKVHRGLHQIGGCITEISTATSRVFIDMGKNLPGLGQPTTPQEGQRMVEGIFAQNPKEHEAVFYTHTHADHIGLFWAVPSHVPQYLGKVSKDSLKSMHHLVREGHQLSKKNVDSDSDQCRDLDRKIEHENNLLAIIDKMHTWKWPKEKRNPEPMHVGDISITPYYCCHSSIEAFMFLIEADGKRIWHTGDFRYHGYLGKSLFKMLETYARNIDTLIIEGTMLGREDKCITEDEVSKQMAQVMQEYKNVFILVSSTNIERLVAIRRAAEQVNRRTDLYLCSGFIDKTMSIGRRTMSNNSRSFFNFPRVSFIELSGDLPQSGFIIPVPLSKMDDVGSVLSKLNPDETVLIFSSWDGYYKDPEQIAANPRYKQFHEMFDNVVDIHTSGHADRQTLAQAITIINPKESIIGIHKDPDTSHKSLNIPQELKDKVQD